MNSNATATVLVYVDVSSSPLRFEKVGTVILIGANNLSFEQNGDKNVLFLNPISIIGYELIPDKSA